MIINASPNFVVPNDTNVHTAFSLTIPGGTLGANGGFRVTATWSSGAAVGNHLVNILFGALNVQTYTFGTTITMQESIARVSNNGSESSQTCFRSSNTAGYPGVSTSPVQTSALDTTQDVVLSITAQKTAAARALTLLTVVIEIFGNRSSL